MDPLLKRQILDRIDTRLEDLKISDRAVGVEAGLGPDLVRDWRRTKAMPRLDSLAAIAATLKTRPEWLAYGAGPRDAAEASIVSDVRSIPVVSWVAASRFADTPHVTDLEDAPRVAVGDLPAGEYIALDVAGDSMNIVAPDGARIIVKTSDRELYHRRFYVFRSDDGATFKRYMQDPDRLEPYSTNPVHEALPMPRDIAVIGRVVRAITEL